MRLARLFKRFSFTTSQFYTKNARYLPSIFLLYLTFLLTHQFVVSDITRISEIKQKNFAFYSTENNRLLKENEELKAQLRYLSENTELVESLARSELGYIKAGEKFYTYGVQSEEETLQTPTYATSP